MKRTELVWIYRRLGMSVIPINRDKSPRGKNWNRYAKKLQTDEEFQDFLKGIDNYDAIGVVPCSSYFIIDFDKLSSIEEKKKLILFFCEFFNIPQNQMMISKSGSGKGFHIWVKCDISKEMGDLTVKTFDNIVMFLCKQLELRWRGITIVPDSKTEAGEYKFISPNRVPPEIDAKRLFEFIAVITTPPNLPISAAAAPNVTLDIESNINQPISLAISELDLRKVEELVKLVEAKSLDATNVYENWFKIGMALASLKEQGRNFFHRLSRFHPDYNQKESDEFFSQCLKDYNGKITLGTLFFIYKDAGIVVSDKMIFFTPLLEGKHLKLLPEPIKSFASIFKGRNRERDIAILSSIVMFGSLFDRIKVFHDDKYLNITLFLMITAPAASGKGAISLIAKAVEKVHDQKRAESKTEEDAIDNDSDEKSEQPPIPKSHLIPANISSTALILALLGNSSTLMLDEEVDNFINTSKQEWANQLSEIIRKIYDNSRLSLGRAQKDKRLVEIPKPNMSIIFGGTFIPTLKLFSSTENGLASRFMFYLFNEKAELRNPFVMGHNSNFIDLATEAFGNSVYEIWSKIKDSEEVVFSFTPEQGELLHSMFLEYEKEIPTEIQELFRSIHVRLMVNTSRIAGIIATLRILETQDYLPERYHCSAEDFEIVTAIVRLLFTHGIALFSNVPKVDPLKLQGDNAVKIMFYEKLPEAFQRVHAIEIAHTLKISVRSADSHLEKFVLKGLLFKVKNGEYSKKPIKS